MSERNYIFDYYLSELFVFTGFYIGNKFLMLWKMSQANTLEQVCQIHYSLFWNLLLKQ